VLLELRDKNDPAFVVASQAALVQRDGDVVAANGTAPVRFVVPHDDYHLAIRHRNHLGVMTAAPLTLTGATTVVDMTLPATPTHGAEARRDTGGVMTLWSGNVIPDEALKYTGASNDRDAILAAIGGLTPTATAAGYLPGDVNMDGVVKYVGADNDRDPILSGLGGTTATSIRMEQLPSQ